MENVKVAIWGFGAMGAGIGEVLLRKKGVEITGVCDVHPARAGKSIFEVLGLSGTDATVATTTINNPYPGIIIEPDIEKALAAPTDVCILATDSFVKKAVDKIILLLEKGVNVITTAEEMSYPKARFPEESARMDAAARANGVSVLGTGINPGLVMDLLAICLSGAMTDVESVLCRRVNSLSPFGPAVMEEQGVGLSQEDFARGMENGSLAGHVGFAESVGMINDALGLGVDRFEQQMAPIVTGVDRKSPHGFAAAGRVAGVDMKGQGFAGGAQVVTMEHPQQIEPELGGVSTGDYVTLAGRPPVRMAITPEIDGGLGTIAMCVNCIPQTINARPGLLTMVDIPVPHAIMGDFRDHIDEARKLVK